MITGIFIGFIIFGFILYIGNIPNTRQKMLLSENCLIAMSYMRIVGGGMLIVSICGFIGYALN